MNHLLADVRKTCLFGQYRDVAVHLTIDLYRLHHIDVVGFQAAVKVVQLNLRHTTSGPIEKLGWDILCQFGIVTHFLPARNQVVMIFGNHAVELGNLVGTVLKIGIHRDDHIALHHFKSSIQRRRFAVVSSKLDTLHTRVLSAKFFNDAPRLVGRAIVHHHYLVRERVFLHHTFNPCHQLRQRFFFVIKRYYNRYVHAN